MGGRYKTIHRNDEIYRERAVTRRKEEQEEEMRDKRLGVFRNTFSRTDKIPPFVLICAAHKCPQVPRSLPSPSLPLTTLSLEYGNWFNSAVILR